jgi:hypothetical protein
VHKGTPADAPWLVALRAEIQHLVKDSGVDSGAAP